MIKIIKLNKPKQKQTNCIFENKYLKYVITFTRYLNTI